MNQCTYTNACMPTTSSHMPTAIRPHLGQPSSTPRTTSVQPPSPQPKSIQLPSPHPKSIQLPSPQVMSPGLSVHRPIHMSHSVIFRPISFRPSSLVSSFSLYSRLLSRFVAPFSFYLTPICACTLPAPLCLILGSSFPSHDSAHPIYSSRIVSHPTTHRLSPINTTTQMHTHRLDACMNLSPPHLVPTSMHRDISQPTCTPVTKARKSTSLR